MMTNPEWDNDGESIAEDSIYGHSGYSGVSGVSWSTTATTTEGMYTLNVDEMGVHANRIDSADLITERITIRPTGMTLSPIVSVDMTNACWMDVIGVILTFIFYPVFCILSKLFKRKIGL